VLAQARAAENAARFLEGKQVVKEIFVPGKLVNFVVR
jgi:leucyl-tRNA synthetase